MTTPTEPTTRHCTQCGRELPIVKFSLYKKNEPKRRGECNSCRNIKEKIKRANKRRRDISKSLTKILSERDLNKVVHLVNGMIRFHGGMDQMAKRWKQAIDDAPPNSMFAMRSMTAIIHLATVIGPKQERDEAEWLQTATDEQLECEVLRHAQQIIARRRANATRSDTR